MPVSESIQWKPLRDSHYVIASLLPGGGGLRQIFVVQSTLREIQALARGDPELPLVGLLLGRRLDCSVTVTPYILIESHVEVALVSLDERDVSDAIRTLHRQLGRRRSPEVLGWYCCSRSTEPAVSPTHAAVHAACFAERWPAVLILGHGGHSGSFFLHDPSAGRWFHAPFYEVTDSKAKSRAAKPTCVAWPAYLTTELVVPLAATRRRVLSPPARASVAAPASAPARQQSVAFARLVVRVRRTPADAMVGVRRAAMAARRSALDLARALGPRFVSASRHATETIVRTRAAWAARAARRKAEADAARAREEERRAKEAAERRAAREEAQRRAAEAEKRRAAEAEARRAAEMEARRRAAEEAERRRAAEAEARRQAAEAEERRQAAAEAARRAAEAEAQRKAAEEAERRAAEAEARRKAAAEAQRKAAEEEQRRAAEAEAHRQAAEAEARRREAEAEARRLAEEAELEAQRKAAEAQEDARRKAAEAEEETRRKAAEAEALRISVEVAALRKRLARAPDEESKRETPRAAVAQMADVEDTTTSDGPYRYLALARREGFEVSGKIERGSSEPPETVWLLYEQESGLRLIVVATDAAVREASLHYNLRTDDESLLQNTPPEHRDLESRTIYGREACLHDLRVRCRRLRATGALERDWKVSPTLQHSVSPQ